MILLIDNFDSFTFNLYQYLGELGESVTVIRNNQLTIKQIREMNPKAIILSPGPGKPEDAGICIDVIRNLYQEFPILGICLGHQAIGAAFGSEIRRANFIKHGKTSQITHSGNGIFTYLTSPLEVMRYHSLVVDQGTLSSDLECVAKSLDDQEVMAIKHRYYPVFGLQFHPESIGTPLGKQMLQNFLSEIEGKKKNEKFFTPVS
ncbi:aminodeoxychorismate/anthranilate synthase component II [Neobacillus niacini]|uniref:anthranilate synthase component II n=1 Tax=Neobacillus niacini TaxID=86668 RepID=UPI001C8D3B3E|nr:aminodeoxychorismate/anthranilate synthase component II [Neobacillus niacini]MBY0146016.1 aminodeoxychorismate/anthranilate synthase component II [Neobacillus niacini]